MLINRANSVNGEISLPGDKSISHRAAMIGAMAVGETRIDNFSSSEDCSTTLSCLSALGVRIERDGNSVGIGGGGMTAGKGAVYCGNSGTTMRLLAGVLAGQNIEATLTGDASLERRPMGRIIEPLEKMGAMIDSRNGSAPLTTRGTEPLRPIVYRPDVPSAQVKSCILLAALNAEGESVVIEATPTRDHTERLLSWFGVDVGIDNIRDESRISVKGGQVLRARDVTVAGDISSAAFFLVAATFLKGSDLTMRDVGINPTRRAIVDLLVELGSNIEISGQKMISNEPVATLKVRSRTDSGQGSPGTVLEGNAIAELIDEIPILAVAGTQLESGLEIRNAGELRVKESDRISAVVENLRRMGAAVTEHPDGFKVERCELKGAHVDSYGDHRIAMAFAIAGLLATGTTEIKDAESAGISFPGFFETLASVVR
jgi:3-phosphoshikimate 1-carboxyvinyltransferase